ncbi:MAG TPA: DUF1178 family protein [Rhodopila sp.]|jgi:hypothetical protein|nr:DUF1178 family protein [Rhodopila sp.]
MIHYQLRCSEGHQFDGWFKDSASFEKQAHLGLVECPECGGTEIERALMAPAVTKGATPPSPAPSLPPSPGPAQPNAAGKTVSGPIPAMMLAMLQKVRAEVEKNCDYVGSEFAEEARRMHRGEIEQRGIYGEASEDQAESLLDEGIEIARIPWVPRADG